MVISLVLLLFIHFHSCFMVTFVLCLSCLIMTFVHGLSCLIVTIVYYLSCFMVSFFPFFSFPPIFLPSSLLLMFFPGALFKDGSFDHILSHPPYHRCIVYSSYIENDLSRCASLDVHPKFNPKFHPKLT